MMPYSIKIQNISKNFKIYHEKHDSVFEKLTSILHRKQNYENFQALTDVSFQLETGEMLGIIGLNGSGKTTLLKIISGIMKPDTGTIQVNGKITPILNLGIGFQPELTAYDNIFLYGAILGFKKNEIIKKILPILKFAELENFADTKIKNFSSGMYARLAFSTAIQIDPDILLIDEILSVGDLHFQQKSFEAITSFKNRQKTIVFVSHDVNSVANLSDRVILLHKGRIHFSGKPDEAVSEYLRLINEEN